MGGGVSVPKQQLGGSSFYLKSKEGNIYLDVINGKVIESTNSKGIFKIIDKNNKPVSSLKNTNDYYILHSKTNKYITKKSLFGGCK